jgi:hypothetical protein
MASLAPHFAPAFVADEAYALAERVLSYLDAKRRLVPNNMVRDAVDDRYLAYADREFAVFFAAFRAPVEGKVRSLRVRLTG